MESRARESKAARGERYFFHLKADGASGDAVGSPLPDLATAQREAVLLLAETLRDRGAEFWESTTHAVTCTDEAGRTIFELSVNARLAGAQSLSG